MDIRPLTPDFAVSPQIDPEDVPAIAAAGYTTLINNRPCEEIPPSHHADVMAEAAAAAGIDYVVLPLTHQSMTMERVVEQRSAIDAATGPVLAYCASGTRSTIIWAFGQAGTRPVDEIIETAGRYGYDLRAMRGQLEALAQQTGAA